MRVSTDSFGSTAAFRDRQLSTQNSRSRQAGSGQKFTDRFFYGIRGDSFNWLFACQWLLSKIRRLSIFVSELFLKSCTERGKAWCQALEGSSKQ